MSDLAEKILAAAQAQEDTVPPLHMDGRYVGPRTDAERAVLRRCAAARELLDEIFNYEARIDGEWGCCHSAEQIRAGQCPETNVDKIPAVRAMARGYGLEVDG